MMMMTSRKLGYGFIFAFHSNCGCIFSRFDTMHERDRHTLHDSIGRIVHVSHGKNCVLNLV